ncbi:helix-turn-helix domain-containing protein [Burkholderia pseudomallei]|uniref:Transcriptional regulator, IclR family n=7 Tax=pseudomallei group TaxID=111527 RepID=Q3JHI5_BURP1|nr:transcriptional regulator, IclR family [Burkholderia mallei ATCC 23344]ABA52101.1 transcriptional regulator, IclR family [Burkholderia pseudomallei 1710b]AUL59590.1 IclR family transcriptional regulator [Burkholderia pseudomallei]EBA47771.1 Pca regulon regulatory protein [Burkholderia pseudomallei 305]EEP51391.1 beta-ketoadipate pathway transcriptional regulator, PcaR/PcaU/PobR family [Burkholderia pseudomallei MSHR346]KGS41554.1 beta-ketoadipate pathway transcriptional regulator, PcaR/PcaU
MRGAGWRNPTPCANLLRCTSFPPAMSTEFQAKPGDSYVQSFARGLAVIRAFDAEHPEQTLTEVASATGLTRAGARRILLTLQTLGYVEADGRLFRLTPKILDLGFAYLTSMPFWNLAEPVMEQLSARIHESCSAAVLDRTEIVYVLRVPTHKIMTINLSIGSRLPAYCTSMGRVLLSSLDAAALDDTLARSTLRAYTPRTLTDPAALKDEIATVRSQGWAIVDQELEAGLISLSAPIRNRRGQVIAAMNISGNAQRHTAKQMVKAFLDPLLEASQTVSQLVARRG